MLNMSSFCVFVSLFFVVFRTVLQNLIQKTSKEVLKNLKSSLMMRYVQIVNSFQFTSLLLWSTDYFQVVEFCVLGSLQPANKLSFWDRREKSRDSRTRKETLTPWPLDRKIGCLLTFQRGNWSFRPKVVRTYVVSLEVYLSFFKPFDSPDGCSPGLDRIRPMGETTTILLSHSPITPFFFFQ